MFCFSSNRLEILFEAFKKNLFDKSLPPFAKRVVLTPSRSLHQWLIKKLADSELGVAMGIEVMPLQKGVDYLLSSFTKEKFKFLYPSNLELSLAIEAEIEKIINQKEQKEVFSPLLQFFKKNETNKQKRLIDLSCQLAFLFDRYGKFGKKMVESWQSSEKECKQWQAILWNKLFNDSYRFVFSDLENVEFYKKQQEVSVHLFGISFLPKSYIAFFSSFSSSYSVFSYFLSPCQMYWSDIKSEKESKKWKKLLKTQGVKENVRERLDFLLSETNPLLANLGKLGRKMMSQLEDFDIEPIDCFALPRKFLEKKEYKEAFLPDTLLIEEQKEQNVSLIEALQADLLMIRNIEEGKKVAVKEDIPSIQSHLCSSKVEEVQRLYDYICYLISESFGEILPKDVLVLAPDITSYAPIIQMVFGDETSVLNYQINEVLDVKKQRFFQGFLSFVSLVNSRWQASELMELLSIPEFRKKVGFTKEEVKKIEVWIKKAGVVWGLDKENKEEILGVKKKEGEDFQKGSWSWGLDRLIYGYAYGEKDVGCFKTVDIIETKDAKIIGKLSFLIERLKKDLSPLNDKTKKTLNQWRAYLHFLFESYFEPLDKESECFEKLWNIIDSLKTDDQNLNKESFFFSSIKKQLEKEILDLPSYFFDNQLDGVNFCSLAPMRAIPSKVIAIIGMENSVFPKKDPLFSLNLLEENPLSDYAPSLSDHGRYLFLETLLSVRNYLWLSYPKNVEKGGYDPSILIKELFTYLDQAFLVNDNLPSKVCVYKQMKSWTFQKKVFDEKKKVKLKKRHNFFVKPLKTEKIQKDYLSIDISSLKKFAKDPLSFYLTKSLKMSFKEPGKYLLKDEEDFFLSNLEKTILRNRFFENKNKGFQEVIEKETTLSSNLFKKVETNFFEQEIEFYRYQLRKEGLSFDDLFFVSLEQNKNVSDKKVFSPLFLDFPFAKRCRFAGDLGLCSAKGMVVFNKEFLFSSVICFLPQYLLYLKLCSLYPDVFKERKLIFINKKKVGIFSLDKEEESFLFEDYISYYLEALKEPSPFYHSWVEAYIKKDKNLLRKKFESLDQDYGYTPFYLKFLNESLSFFLEEDHFKKWAEKANALFYPVYKKFNKKRGR